MTKGKWAVLALAAPLLLAGCKGFWDLPAGSFTLTNSGNITVTAGSSGTATITVTPSNSTETVALTCAITSSPSGATSPTTCSLSPTSVSLSGTTAQTSTLTATTTSTTTTGAYQITVTGTSGSVKETTSVCVEVGTSSGCSSSANSSGNFYVLNVETSQIAGFYVKAGVLTALPNSPYSVGATPTAITMAPNNKFLYVSTNVGIFVYEVASDGSLTLGNSSSRISQDQATSMQVTSDNQWLIEVVSGVNSVFAIPINSSDGTVTSNSEQTAPLPSTDVRQVAVSPDHSYVFVAMGSGGTATIPFTTGNTNPFGTVGNIPLANSAGGAALSVAVDPESAPRLFYVGEVGATSGPNTGGLRAFSFSALPNHSEISTASGTGGLAPYSILPTANGSYVYVVNRQTSSGSTGVIKGFSIASSSGSYSLTALSNTFTTGTNPQALAEDNTGNYVFAVDFGGGPDLEGYTFDSTTPGNLDSVLTERTGADPVQASAIAAAH